MPPTKRSTGALLDMSAIAAQRGIRPFDVLMLVRRPGYVHLFQILHEEMISVPRALVQNVERFQSNFCAWYTPVWDPVDRCFDHMHEMKKNLFQSIHFIRGCDREALYFNNRRVTIIDLPKPAPKRTGVVDVNGILAHTFGIIMWATDARRSLFRRLMQYLNGMYGVIALPRFLLLADGGSYTLLRTLAVRHLLGVSRSAPRLGRASDEWSDPVLTIGTHSCWFVQGLGHVIAYDDGNANRTMPLFVHPLIPYMCGCINPLLSNGCFNLPTNAVEVLSLIRAIPIETLKREGCSGLIESIIEDVKGMQRVLDAIHASMHPDHLPQHWSETKVHKFFCLLVLGTMWRDIRLALRMNVLQMPHRCNDSHLPVIGMDGTSITAHQRDLKEQMHRLVMPVSYNGILSVPSGLDPAPVESEVLAADGYALRLGWRQTSIDPSQYSVLPEAGTGAL